MACNEESHTSDMNDVEDDSISTSLKSSSSINDLADECLIPILKKIPQENMDDVSEVSNRWESIIQENIGLDIWATDVGFRFGFRIFNDLSEMGNFIIKSLKSRISDEVCPPLKKPEALLNLELSSPTSMNTFTTLTRGAVNLKELNFGYGSLTMEDIGNVSLDLPNLEILNIADRAFERKDFEWPDKLAKNVTGIMQQLFPALKAFVLSIVATRKATESFGTSLFKFLEIHSSTIKKLKVQISTAIQREPASDYGSLDHVINLEADAMKSLDWVKLSKIRFEELEVNFGQKYFVGATAWQKILVHQECLVHINWSLSMPLPLAVTVPAVILSGSSLVIVKLGLEIYRPEGPTTPLDCTAFENCLNLKMLVVVSNPLYSERPNSPEISNLCKIPRSLQTLVIENIFVETAELISFLDERGQMKKIAVEKAGSEGIYGMTMELLSKMFFTQSVSEILIQDINGDECDLHQYDHLTQLGLKLPLKSAKFHVIFYKHFMEYVPTSVAKSY